MPLGPLPEPSRFAHRLAGLARAVPTTVILFSTLLAFNLVQTLSLIFAPFSKKTFRAINRRCADTWWGWCVLFAEKIYGLKIEFTGEKTPPKENVVVIVNHQQMTDISLLLSLAKRKGRTGDVKWFVKDVVKYVPGVGWGMLFLDCPFVKRDWTADRAAIERTFERLVKHKTPMWLISFSEGTRIKPSKLAASREYAASTGRPVLSHVLVPRVKGFVASVQALRGRLHAVYDVTIGYEPPGVPTLWQYIKGYARRAHLHVRRYPISVLPADEHGLSDWLFARFEEKDALLSHFYEHGRFPGDPLNEPLR